MDSHRNKGEVFTALHAATEVFVMPNPWDAGSARLFASFGFEALGTTSLGLSLKLGRKTVTTEEILRDATEIDAATPLPVTVDLENGGSAAPEVIADVYAHAARIGLAGASIEDASGNPNDPIYPFDLAVSRVAAAVRAIRAIGRPFTLTARADNLINGRPDLDDTIRRLNAFADVGADVLFAPGLREPVDIERVVRSVGRPLNVVATHTRPDLTVSDLGRTGVKRVSVGGSIARYALGAALVAIGGLAKHGTIDFVATAPSSKVLYSRFAAGAADGDPLNRSP